MEQQGRVRPREKVSRTIQNQSNGGPQKIAPLESGITAGILKYLNSLPECFARKTSGDDKRSGELDIDCCYHGLAVKLEVKRPGRQHGYMNKAGNASKLQLATMSKWKAAGAIAAIVYSISDVKLVLPQVEVGRAQS